MTIIDVHQCPRCELRFAQHQELEAHLEDEHDVPLRRPSPGDVDIEPPQPEPVTFGRLVVAVDPTAGDHPAVALAASVAMQAGMAIDLVSATAPGLTPAVTEACLWARARSVRRAGVEDCSWTALDARRPADAILDFVAGRTDSILCLATHSRNALAAMSLGSTSEDVLRRSPVPVLLVGPRAKPLSHITRVVVALDGTEPSERALGPGLQLADRLDASVSLLEVVPAYGVPVDVPDTAYVARLARGLRGAVDCYDVLHGDHPGRALAEWLGSEQDTVLVMATHGRTPLERLLAKSITLGVVRHAPYPVLVVPPAVRAAG